MNIKINHATQKTQRQTHGPTGLCELFLLTVPTEEVARCQYKTVQIIIPLNLQTITITLDVSRFHTGGYSNIPKGSGGFRLGPEKHWLPVFRQPSHAYGYFWLAMLH